MPVKKKRNKTKRNERAFQNDVIMIKWKQSIIVKCVKPSTQLMPIFYDSY